MSSADDPLYPEFGPMRHRQVLRAIEQRWTRKLSFAEVRVLQRLVELTLGWGSNRWKGTTKTITNGRGGEGQWALGPLDLSHSTVERAVRSLKAAGMLSTSVLPDRNDGLMFVIDVDLLLEPWIEGVCPVAIIREPKRLKMEGGSRQADGTVTSQGRDGPVRGTWGSRQADGEDRGTSLEVTYSDQSSKGAGPSPDHSGFGFAEDQNQDHLLPDEDTSEASALPDTAREKVDAAKKKSADRRKTALAEAVERIRAAVPGVRGKKPGAVLARDIRTVWDSAWAEANIHASAAPAWSVADMGKATLLFGRWVVREDGSKPLGEFDEYLAWTIAHWSETVAAHFSRMKDPAPKHPDIGFLLALSPKFEDAWLTKARRALKNSGKLSPLEQLRLIGHSDEEAVEILAERKAKGIARDMARNSPSTPSVRPRTKPLQPVATDRALSPTKAPSTRYDMSRFADKVDEVEAIMSGRRGPTR